MAGNKSSWHSPGVDPGFGQGGPQVLRLKVADIAKQSHMSEVSNLQPESRATSGCLPGPGGSAWSGGCHAGQGVSAWSGGCLPGLGGSGIPACTGADPALWTESQTPVKTLPWPNFVAAGNKTEVLNEFQLKILGSESFARWLVSLALALELELALDIEHYHITASVNHLTCPLPPHQSVICLAHCHHIISQS